MGSTTSNWGNEKSEFFNSLTIDKVLSSVESLGHKTSGRVLQLASMENRVYEVEIYPENPTHVSDHFKIVKFYRPGRWSKAQIQDEHNFLFDLTNNEIHAIAPDKYEDQSVFEDDDGLFFCTFPKQGGRACDEWTDPLLEQMGRLLARLHNTGKSHPAPNRLKLDIDTFGKANLNTLLSNKIIPLEYEASYKNIAEQIFQVASPILSQLKLQRIHGDCHHGNILLNEGQPFLIDFDDMSMGPVVQDLWMIIPGRDQESLRQRNILIQAYQSMTEFNTLELKAIEALRALRIIHFSAWIGLRYEDNSFKNAFPAYGSSQYWEKEVFDLKNQLSLIHQEISPY